MKNICIICNKEFEAKVWNRKICYEDHYKVCKYCNNKFKLDAKSKGPQQLARDYCYNDKCKSEHLKESYSKTMLDRYGVTSTWQLDKTKESIKKTLKENYGVDHPMKSKEIQNKCKETLKRNYGVTSISQLESSKNTVRNKFGVDYAFQSKEIQSKVRDSLFKNYGVTNVYQLESTKESIRKTNMKKYGVTYPMKLKEFQNKTKNTCLKLYGKPYTFMLGNYNAISKINRRFSSYLDKFGFYNSFEFNLDNYNYDIKINDYNILIEIDPTFTHNSTIGMTLNGKYIKPKDKYYHYNKSIVANKHNFICIHKFDWHKDEDILKIINKIINNNNYKIIMNKPKLHWYNCKTGEHILDNNFNKEEMIKNNFLEIYDDGQEIY